MELLKTLKFVRGAVSKTDTNVEMKHFAIEGGHIRATNGVLSIGSPVDLAFTCAPEAESFYKAIGQCKDVVSVKHLEATNRLSIGSGKFRAFVQCIDMTGVHAKPSGTEIPFGGAAILAAFEALEPFVCKDQLRPWTNGILLAGSSACATNNAVLAEYWLGGVPMPHSINIPLVAIREVLRVGMVPERVLMDASSITFLYSDGRWIKSLLLENDWPGFDSVLNVEHNAVPIPPDLFAGVKAVRGFAEGDERNVFFRDGAVHASRHDDTGASYAVEGLATHGAYRVENLMLLEAVAERADFQRWPEAVVFFGGQLRGALMGLAR